MLEFLKKAVKHPLAKEFLRLVLAALAGYGASGCSAFGAAKHPSADVIACKVAVLAPYVGEAADAVSREIDGSRAFNPVEYFLALGLTVDDIAAIAKAYSACVPPMTVPAPAPAEPAPLTRS